MRRGNARARIEAISQTDVKKLANGRYKTTNTLHGSTSTADHHQLDKTARRSSIQFDQDKVPLSLAQTADPAFLRREERRERRSKHPPDSMYLHGSSLARNSSPDSRHPDNAALIDTHRPTLTWILIHLSTFRIDRTCPNHHRRPYPHPHNVGERFCLSVKQNCWKTPPNHQEICNTRRKPRHNDAHLSDEARK